MGKSITVNSEETLQEAIEELTKRFEKYHSGRVELFFGARRSVDQNRMFFEQYTRIGKQLYGGDTQHAKRAHERPMDQSARKCVPCNE